VNTTNDKFIWYLKGTEEYYNKEHMYDEFVICAESEHQARCIAEQHGIKQLIYTQYWRSDEYSLCEKIGPLLIDIELGVISNIYNTYGKVLLEYKKELKDMVTIPIFIWYIHKVHGSSYPFVIYAETEHQARVIAEQNNHPNTSSILSEYLCEKIGLIHKKN